MAAAAAAGDLVVVAAVVVAAVVVNSARVDRTGVPLHHSSPPLLRLFYCRFRLRKVKTMRIPLLIKVGEPVAAVLVVI
jgi:hypothetical protein